MGSTKFDWLIMAGIVGIVLLVTYSFLTAPPVSQVFGHCGPEYQLQMSGEPTPDPNRTPPPGCRD